MRHHLVLEAIGGLSSSGPGPFHIPCRAWVVRLVGDGTATREFVGGRADYSHANSKGSRGIELHYFLPPGRYEVSSPQAWRRTDRYILTVHPDGRGERG
jgi:hypothetical protein